MPAHTLLAEYLARLSQGTDLPLIPIEPAESAQAAVFIDGGSGVLLDSASAALHQIRIARLTYEGLRRTASAVFEYTILVTAAPGGVAVRLEPAHPAIPAHFPWSELDIRRPTVADFASYVRRLLELDAALAASRTGPVVLDGSLEPGGRLEADRLGALLPSGALGVSKTHTLLDAEGHPLAALAARHPGMWLLGPVATVPCVTYLAKLHPRGRLVRLDAAHAPEPRTLGLLAAHARDPTIPGYPWGLIAADTLARVARFESTYYQGKLAISLGPDAALLPPLLETRDAHALLDRLAHRGH